MTAASDQAFAATEAAALLAEHGESVTYTPVGGSAAEITAVVDRDSADVIPALDGETVTRRAVVYPLATAVPGVDRGDEFSCPIEAGGSAVAWQADVVRGPTGGMYAVEVVRYEAVEKTHRDYRLRR